MKDMLHQEWVIASHLPRSNGEIVCHNMVDRGDLLASVTMLPVIGTNGYNLRLGPLSHKSDSRVSYKGKGRKRGLAVVQLQTM